jgi:hypothetical protein
MNYYIDDLKKIRITIKHGLTSGKNEKKMQVTHMIKKLMSIRHLSIQIDRIILKMKF